MSSHDVTVAGYLAVAAVGAGLQAMSARRGSRVPSLGAVFGRAMRSRSGRMGILAGWAWLGLHFFAR